MTLLVSYNLLIFEIRFVIMYMISCGIYMYVYVCLYMFLLYLFLGHLQLYFNSYF